MRVINVVHLSLRGGQVEKPASGLAFARSTMAIIGGGVSKQADKWLPLLDVRPEVRPAQLRNDAGIVGAAVLAARPG